MVSALLLIIRPVRRPDTERGRSGFGASTAIDLRKRIMWPGDVGIGGGVRSADLTGAVSSEVNRRNGDLRAAAALTENVPSGAFSLSYA